MKKALIIFIKNPVYGQVKTRLAATAGNVKALEIYKQLVQHTYSITHHLSVEKIIFYSNEIIEDDVWKDVFKKQLQCGNDLGERMMQAFNYTFKNNYSNVVIIGTDCPELNEQMIENAFEKLNEHDVVLGPAADGGYYLLGMKNLHKHLFIDVEWSTNKVLQTTMERCMQHSLNYFLLDELHDVDEEKDLQYMKHL